MANKAKLTWAGIIVFLSIIGPGIITSNVDNDAGGIATYSAAGANFGYSLLWTLAPITVALFVVQEMAARMGVVTGKGLSDLIRENFGVKTTFFVMLALVIGNFGNTLAEFAGIATASKFFGVSCLVAVPLSAVLVWLLVVKGNYKSVEKVFLAASAFYVVYIISALLVPHIDWAEVGASLVTPSFKLDSSYLLMLIGIIGTTIAPWMQFYIQASIVEKRVNKKYYFFTRWDVIIGSVMVSVVAFFIILACAATIHANGLHIKNDVDFIANAARALAPFAGELAGQLFALGLLNASLFSAAILPLSTAYFVCEAFGWEAGVDKKLREAPQFYGLFTAFIVFGAALILVPGTPLLPIMLISQAANGILLPFILVFMLLIINKKEVMGKYKNDKFFNVLAGATTAIMFVLSLLLAVTTFFPGVFG
jgi:NRAMP (natural resistance-associated macrophage protein)-like metal ion transporter